MLTDADAVRHGPALKVNPPLRAAHDVHAVRAALLDGTIDIVATDHAPHPARTKTGSWQDAAFGLTALETALAVTAEVCTSGTTVDWATVARVLSTRPAEIGRIDGQAGRPIVAGGPATFCVVRRAPWRVDPADGFSRSSNTLHGPAVSAPGGPHRPGRSNHPRLPGSVSLEATGIAGRPGRRSLSRNQATTSPNGATAGRRLRMW
ncbi:amidohydrolase family protein [Dactylosporangium cerinum]